MRTSRVQRIAQYLTDNGPTNTVQIAKALGETTDSIASAIQHERNRNRWGIVKLGRDPAAGGKPILLWGIDIVEVRRKPVRKLTPVARQPSRTKGLVLNPESPYKTNWQPSSVYGSKP